jgi:hypothetical protein
VPALTPQEFLFSALLDGPQLATAGWSYIKELENAARDERNIGAHL